MQINFQHPNLVHVVISGMRVEPQHAIKLLASGEADIVDVRYVYIDEGVGEVFKSYAKAWQTQPNVKGQPQYHQPDGFRIGAGAYGDMTVLTAGEIGKPRQAEPCLCTESGGAVPLGTPWPDCPACKGTGRPND